MSVQQSQRSNTLSETTSGIINSFNHLITIMVKHKLTTWSITVWNEQKNRIKSLITIILRQLILKIAAVHDSLWYIWHFSALTAS